MNRTRIFIALLATSAVFTSCKRAYKCTCEIRPDAQPRQNTQTLFEVKAKDRTKAAQLCDNFDDNIKDCSLQ